MPFWHGLCVCGRMLACSVGEARGGLCGQAVTYVHQLYKCFPQWLHGLGQPLTCPRALPWPSSPADMAISTLQELGWQSHYFLSCKTGTLLISSSS